MTDPMTAEQARALSAPSRRAILEFLGGADRAVTVAELTEHLGLNHNAVRKHLAQLTTAGLVTEARERRDTRGRPRLLYRLAPSKTDEAQSYRRLAMLLATALTEGADPAVVGRRAAARDGAGVSSGDPVEALAERFALDGFDPSVRRRGKRTELVLGRCPFVDAAEANPDVVCRLHLGLAKGAADAIGGLQVDGLTPHDPRRAGCRVAVSGTPSDVREATTTSSTSITPRVVRPVETVSRTSRQSPLWKAGTVR